MTKRRFTPAYPAELRERGVRLFRENRADYTSDTAAYRAIAPKLGCSPDIPQANRRFILRHIKTNKITFHHSSPLFWCSNYAPSESADDQLLRVMSIAQT